MLQHILELKDGTLLRAGEQEPAILHVELTQSVNTGEVLSVGSVCATMVRVGLFVSENNPLPQGSQFTLYEEDEAGTQTKIGVFLAEEPQWTSTNTLMVTAYDPVTLLDRDLTQWLKDLNGWPYTLGELASLVCDACGVALSTTQIPNGSHPVRAITAQGITGRQLISWIAQGAGCFCRANEEGLLEFGWYSPSSLTYGPTDGVSVEAAFADGTLALTGDFSCTQGENGLALENLGAVHDAGELRLESGMRYYYQNGLQLAEFSTAPVEKVQLSAKEEDVGTVCPDITGQANTYRIVGNPLLVQEDAEGLQSVAQTLYERLSSVTYTPGTMTVPAGTAPMPGSIITVVRKDGTTATMYIMERFRSGSRDTVTCCGTARLDSTTAVNNQSYQALSGKVLRLRTDVEGILAENQDTQGRLSKVELDLEGISATVQAVKAGTETTLTTLQQTADSISATVQTLSETGTDKLSTAFGLTIDGSRVTIHREGSEMENTLNERGMSVVRGEGAMQTVMLKADSDGVLATDVEVRNYLVVGDHARLEDYGSDRTACFYV